MNPYGSPDPQRPPVYVPVPVQMPATKVGTVSKTLTVLLTLVGVFCGLPLLVFTVLAAIGAWTD